MFCSYSPYYLYNKMFYPTYLGGFTYFMSFDVAKKLYEGAFEIQLFHMEDIYITGMLAKHKSVKLTKSNLLAFLPVNNLCKLKGLISEQGRHYHQKLEAFNFMFSSSADECELLGEFRKYLCILIVL